MLIHQWLPKEGKGFVFVKNAFIESVITKVQQLLLKVISDIKLKIYVQIIICLFHFIFKNKAFKVG